MLSSEDSRRALRLVFRHRRVADLPVLLRALHTDWPMNVFRRLRPLGYLTSYSHSGRYYTLEDIAEFDADGLWQYQGIFFSRHGTLKATTARLVDSAETGYTHKELEARLHVRVHNTLLDLVRGNRIGRERVESLYLYVSADAARGSLQVNRRRQLQSASTGPARDTSRPLVIEVLLEIIHGAHLVSDPADVLSRLLARGIQVTRSQVDAIFAQHGLKKTLARRSRFSQR